MTQPGYGQPKQTYEMILRAVNLDRKDVLSKSDPFLTVYSTLYKTPGPKTGKKHKEAKTGPNPNKIPIHRFRSSLTLFDTQQDRNSDELSESKLETIHC